MTICLDNESIWIIPDELAF